MNKFKVVLHIAVVIIFIVCFLGTSGMLVENMEIPVGVGADIEKSSNDISYNIPLLVYSFENVNQVMSTTITGSNGSLGQTIQNRQLKEGKKSTLGLNRVFLFSEETAMFGIKNFLDIWVKNQATNDRALCAVCKGNAKDIFKYKTKEYSNAAEYIEGMIKNLREYNFFSMQYTAMDLIVRVDAEGRNVLLPYIELKDDTIETTGLAIFKGDVMVGKADMNETRIINILKENRVRGILTLQKDSKHYINCYAYSKRKVKCYREDGKYKFIIYLDIQGNMVSNELYSNLCSNSQLLKRYEADMKNFVEKKANEAIKNIKCKYKTDVLDLGKIAISKYGRGTGTDWDKVVCDSEIQINVKFKVNTEGRGDY
ncbi:Ger(x)C family spore germination C-terminal domain-containing protein [Clostridium kluyveri]|uniref:Ger(x)C family spore germination C-terminal domain-containing protein n=1 Tax=Clostridium kluyveri TaxID=1534 RepID=UPI0022457EE2|nr:Ger(x)C family spore germination C-terminal domain-containing protein [Clostridium kluyveri]UZQ50583.1 Ger(x)C family spore germination protein [Clostridium kluyveri]